VGVHNSRYTESTTRGPGKRVEDRQFAHPDTVEHRKFGFTFQSSVGNQKVWTGVGQSPLKVAQARTLKEREEKKERKRTVRSAIVFMFVGIWHSGLGGCRCRA